MDNGFRNGRHYFIGDKRVASRIGSGSFNNVYGQNGSFLTAGQQDYAERMSQIENQREDYYRELGISLDIIQKMKLNSNVNESLLSL